MVGKSKQGGGGPGLKGCTAEERLRTWPVEALRRRNLAGLAARDAALAERIGAAAIPEHVEFVAAQDGWPTYRVRRADGRREWLGHTSVPGVWAAASVKRIELGSGCLALEGIGSGAEAEAILGAMAPYQALIVIEREASALALAFRLRDFAEALAAGRLVLLAGEDVEKLVEGFYERERGYNPISQTLAWPWRSDRENQAFAGRVSAAMERATRRSAERMGRALEGRAAWDQPVTTEAWAQRLARPDGLRVANCTNAYTPTDYCTSRDALAGLARLGGQTDWQVLNRPEAISREAQWERLERLRPELVLLVDTLRADAAVPLPRSAACVTLLQEPVVLLERRATAVQRMGEQDFICGARQEDLAALREAGVEERRLIRLLPAANTELFRSGAPGEAARGPLWGGDVVFIGDRHSLAPERYEIKLPTHQALWRAAAAAVRQDAGRYERERAGQYLARVEAGGVRLQEEDLRKLFTDLMENYLGETALREAYLGVLAAAGVAVRVWSRASRPEAAVTDEPGGWAEGELAERAAGTIGYGEELNELYHAGKIFVRLDSDGRPGRYLLNGVAAGAFFLVRAHSRDPRPGGIGEMFEIGREIITFSTPKDLVRKVGYYLGHDEERRAIAAAGRARLLRDHSWAVRAREMLAAMQQRLTGD